MVAVFLKSLLIAAWVVSKKNDRAMGFARLMSGPKGMYMMHSLVGQGIWDVSHSFLSPNVVLLLQSVQRLLPRF